MNVDPKMINFFFYMEMFANQRVDVSSPYLRRWVPLSVFDGSLLLDYCSRRAKVPRGVKVPIASHNKLLKEEVMLFNDIDIMSWNPKKVRCAPKVPPNILDSMTPMYSSSSCSWDTDHPAACAYKNISSDTEDVIPSMADIFPGSYMTKRNNINGHDEQSMMRYDRGIFRAVQLYQAVYSEIKPFACKICNKTFQSKDQLARHSVWFHANTKSCSCNVCGKKFRYNCQLKRHMDVHSKVRLFPCCVCDKRFKQKEHVKRHMVTHSEIKQFSCDVCQKKFKLQGDVKKHMIIHSDIKPFSCNICLKKFKRSHELKNHSVVHSDIRPFSCNICQKKFKVKSGLKRHMAVHGDFKPCCNI